MRNVNNREIQNPIHVPELMDILEFGSKDDSNKYGLLDTG